MSNIDSFTITRPAAADSLLHWKVMAGRLQHLPIEVQTEVKMSEYKCDYWGGHVDLSYSDNWLTATLKAPR